MRATATILADLLHFPASPISGEIPRGGGRSP